MTNLVKRTNERRRFYRDDSVTEIDTAYSEWSKGNYYKDSDPKSETYGWFIEIETGLPVCKY